jgi:hypothetical protein
MSVVAVVANEAVVPWPQGLLLAAELTDNRTASLTTGEKLTAAGRPSVLAVSLAA